MLFRHHSTTWPLPASLVSQKSPKNKDKSDEGLDDERPAEPFEAGITIYEADTVSDAPSKAPARDAEARTKARRSDRCSCVHQMVMRYTIPRNTYTYTSAKTAIREEMTIVIITWEKSRLKYSNEKAQPNDSAQILDKGKG